MSTLQHTPHSPVVHNRIALVALLTGALAAVIVALAIATSGGASSVPSSPHPSQAQLQRQLESVNGARFGMNRPASPTQTPQQQLQAVSGARYHQPAWLLRQR